MEREGQREKKAGLKAFNTKKKDASKHQTVKPYTFILKVKNYNSKDAKNLGKLMLQTPVLIVNRLCWTWVAR